MAAQSSTAPAAGRRRPLSSLLRVRTRVAGVRPLGDDAGMSTAEYAIGTVAACGFAGLLLKILTSPEVAGLLKDLIKRAFSFAF